MTWLGDPPTWLLPTYCIAWIWHKCQSSTNALILLLIGLNLNLSEIVTIILSLMPKNNIFPNWSLHHLIIHGASGKLSINS